MTPDAATMIAYSAGLFALIFVFFLLSSRGRADRVWFALPFACGAATALLMVYPALLPGLWSGRLAVVCSLLGYGAAWQVVRVVNGRKPRVLRVALRGVAGIVVGVRARSPWRARGGLRGRSHGPDRGVQWSRRLGVAA